jgi:hypothetical protein
MLRVGMIVLRPRVVEGATVRHYFGISRKNWMGAVHIHANRRPSADESSHYQESSLYRA